MDPDHLGSGCFRLTPMAAYTRENSTLGNQDRGTKRVVHRAEVRGGKLLRAAVQCGQAYRVPNNSVVRS